MSDTRAPVACRPPLLPLLAWLLLGSGCGEYVPDAGRIEGPARGTATLLERSATQEAAHTALGLSERGQILFGDLHVHTTFSIDALLYALPLFGSEGAHPPADACDFARYCAGLDFFSLNDHAEGLSLAQWEEIKQSIRDCNTRAGDPADPDLVAFTGWEWTQVGGTPETHYGHKNVIFRELADDALPARPISSVPVEGQPRPPTFVFRGAAALARLFGYAPYGDVALLMASMADVPDCDPRVNTRELPLGCRESAETPAELFRKLDEWGFPSLVIPHGLAWGIHAVPGTRLDVQLTRAQHDPARQRLIEVMSGHGNSEEFRTRPEHVVGAAGEPVCSEPTPDYLPCCWRAGEIMRERCGDLPADVCETRVEEAKRLALDAGVAPHWIFPDVGAEAWLDCDQCRDCFKPAMNLRPGQTAQYGAAITSFEDPADPQRFRWGFIASTDNHAARPGTGYKQYERVVMTDARGFGDESTQRRMTRLTMGRQQDPRRAQPASQSRLGELFDVDREASFMYPGGVVATHAAGRDRASIWDALVRREVYGTSGPRILLWFDLVNAREGRLPMGSETALGGAPRFEVRAAGARVEQPGCPDEGVRGLSAERLHDLCRDECHHPGDTRHPIVAIEVIRIRPQARAGERVAGLIEDPWRRFECPPDPNGCRIAFEDPDFEAAGRDTVYYVRALQEATPAINAAGVRTVFDERGRAVSAEPCFGSWRTPGDDDCLAPANERAWSSPIYVDFAG